MTKRVVLIQFLPEADERQKRDMHHALMNLQAEIPQIASISGGLNQSDRGAPFEYVLLVEFRSLADMDIYETHPAHLQVIERWIKPVRADSRMYYFS